MVNVVFVMVELVVVEVVMRTLVARVLMMVVKIKIVKCVVMPGRLKGTIQSDDGGSVEVVRKACFRHRRSGSKVEVSKNVVKRLIKLVS